MSQKIKHSKIKNTGLLFEILTRQVTADILNNKKSKSVNLLKKYFNENTALGKEKELYDILDDKYADFINTNLDGISASNLKGCPSSLPKNWICKNNTLMKR